VYLSNLRRCDNMNKSIFRISKSFLIIIVVVVIINVLVMYLRCLSYMSRDFLFCFLMCVIIYIYIYIYIYISYMYILNINRKWTDYYYLITGMGFFLRNWEFFRTYRKFSHFMNWMSISVFTRVRHFSVS
jgi:hypothetical protein